MSLEGFDEKSLADEFDALQKENNILKGQIRKAYNIIPIPIAITKDNRFIIVNQAWLDLLEYTSDEVIGNTAQTLGIFADSAEQQKVKQIILQGGSVLDQELRIKTKTGKIKIGLFTGGLISTLPEAMLITTMIDITEKKNQQEKLIRAEAEREKIETLKREIDMKDEFISLVSHEFKTPLAVIYSAIQAMEFICKNELSDKAKGFLDKIRQNTSRQLKLVNNLLDVTRLKARHLKINKKDIDVVSLTRSITESIKIYAEQKSIKVLFSSTLEKKVMGIDEEKYERILLNLLSNAIKFTPKGKSIHVKVSQKVVNGKCKVCIRIIDKGVGIPPDKKEVIFEKFGQVDSSLSRKAEGTGIGLYLVKMLVDILDGHISVESQEGVGSTFTILFPIVKVNDTPIEYMLKEISDNRLIQAATIEFSDVYL